MKGRYEGAACSHDEHLGLQGIGGLPVEELDGASDVIGDISVLPKKGQGGNSHPSKFTKIKIQHFSYNVAPLSHS